jgi:hypothetical protein
MRTGSYVNELQYKKANIYEYILKLRDLSYICSRSNYQQYTYILSRDSEVTLSHWSLSIELVITPLIDL